ncbi:MAG: prepilin-type N-terminal cleavage/methylation domain-containing protein [Romboutsia sp.]|nr:prepilin-type N-terminal cleavage/methylation domain-containing protein [Romboutsia sp.]
MIFKIFYLRSMKINREKGFTLIELLVSVALIGILSAISISVYDEYKTKAYDVATQMLVKDLSNILYAISSDGPVLSARGNMGPDEFYKCTKLAYDSMNNDNNAVVDIDTCSMIYNFIGQKDNGDYLHEYFYWDTSINSERIYVDAYNCKGGSDAFYLSDNGYDGSNGIKPMGHGKELSLDYYCQQ